MSTYICVNIYLSICICIYIFIHKHTYFYVYIYVYVYIDMYIFTSLHTFHLTEYVYLVFRTREVLPNYLFTRMFVILQCLLYIHVCV